MEKVTIFDTTLRDGEQCPGAKMDPRQKLKVAEQLAVLGVDVIEAGFPVSNRDDFCAVSQIAREVKGPVICAFAMLTEKSIASAVEALKGAERRRILAVIGTSERRRRTLNITEDALLERIKSGVTSARKCTDNVQFAPEDGSRTEPDFLCRAIEVAIEGGASSICIPDTVGVMLPHQFAALFTSLRNRVSGAERVVWSAHCHNDLGLAVANSLAAIQAGAREVHCTVNGIGERAGNTSLEEIVMVLQRHPELGYSTDVVTQRLGPTSRLLSEIIGWPIPLNKAIVGGNAFSHEAGIHQDGVLKDPATYEIMSPEMVGWQGTRFVIGKHSGRHVIIDRLVRMQIPDALHERVATAFLERVKAGELPTDELLKSVIAEMPTP